MPSGTELEYKVVHVHHSGVRWESIDNRVLVVTPEAGSSVQDSQEAVTNGSTSDQTADSSGASDGQAGVLRAMDVTCGWDLPYPLEIAVDLDPETAPNSPEDMLGRDDQDEGHGNTQPFSSSKQSAADGGPAAGSGNVVQAEAGSRAASSVMEQLEGSDEPAWDSACKDLPSSTTTSAMPPDAAVSDQVRLAPAFC